MPNEPSRRVLLNPPSGPRNVQPFGFIPESSSEGRLVSDSPDCVCLNSRIALPSAPAISGSRPTPKMIMTIVRRMISSGGPM